MNTVVIVLLAVTRFVIIRLPNGVVSSVTNFNEVGKTSKPICHLFTIILCSRCAELDSVIMPE